MQSKPITHRNTRAQRCAGGVGGLWKTAAIIYFFGSHGGLFLLQHADELDRDV